MAELMFFNNDYSTYSDCNYTPIITKDIIEYVNNIKFEFNENDIKFELKKNNTDFNKNKNFKNIINKMLNENNLIISVNYIMDVFKIPLYKSYKISKILKYFENKYDHIILFGDIIQLSNLLTIKKNLLKCSAVISNNNIENILLDMNFNKNIKFLLNKDLYNNKKNCEIKFYPFYNKKIYQTIIKSE